MEFTWEKAKGKTAFATYIRGDGYFSSLIYHSEQTSNTGAQGLYFGRAQHRSGSILAITVKNGTFKEKRHFDAWEGQGLKKAKNLAY